MKLIYKEVCNSYPVWILIGLCHDYRLGSWWLNSEKMMTKHTGNPWWTPGVCYY